MATLPISTVCLNFNNGPKFWHRFSHLLNSWVSAVIARWGRLLFVVHIQSSMTIWAGQILSGLGFTVWAYSNNFLLADHTLRTQFKFLSCFEANRGGNGLDQARSVRKVLIGAKWRFGPWPNHAATFHFYLLITHSPHSFSSSNALPLLLSSSLLSPMCFFDLLITASKDYEWADRIGQCVTWHVERPKTFIFILNDPP